MSTSSITPSELTKLVKARMDTIAPTISDQPRGLAYHRPESWADASRCFENVSRKVAQDGGRILFGWTFHLRFAEDIPDAAYLFLAHHAVWHGPDGRLINVTRIPTRSITRFQPRGRTSCFLSMIKLCRFVTVISSRPCLCDFSRCMATSASRPTSNG
jgi:hypothetical protein